MSRSTLRRTSLLVVLVVLLCVLVCDREDGRDVPSSTPSTPPPPVHHTNRSVPEPLVPLPLPTPTSMSARAGCTERLTERRAAALQRLHSCDLYHRSCQLEPLGVEYEDVEAVRASAESAAREWVEACPGVRQEDVWVDCSEYPCLSVIRETARPLLERCWNQTATPGPPAWTEALPGWQVTPLNAIDGPHTAVKEAATRIPQRLRALHTLPWFADPTVPASTCAELVVDGLSCREASAALGCDPDDVYPLEEAEAHVDEAMDYVDDLLANCPAFVEADPVLQCDVLPCVLVFPLVADPEDEPDDLEDEFAQLLRLTCEADRPTSSSVNFSNGSVAIRLDELGVLGREGAFPEGWDWRRRNRAKSIFTDTQR